MDNSKEFQLMLDKAIESEPFAFKGFDRTKNVQDQLQEMLQKNLWSLCSRIGELCEFGGYPYSLIGSGVVCSMEQLWLVLVMKEKYNKAWGLGWKRMG